MNPGLTHSRMSLLNSLEWQCINRSSRHSAVFELRKVLKKYSENEASYIITVPKRGYRFDGEVKSKNCGAKARS
ncbi:winged helix-turn-helix domain-containing protein [Vibrio fortis]|nr:helix-turn-helix domain-containing protein [Vibrio fortis]